MKLENLWLRGGYPDALLARSPADWHAWQESYLRTFLERDIARHQRLEHPPATFRETVSGSDNAPLGWQIHRSQNISQPHLPERIARGAVGHIQVASQGNSHCRIHPYPQLLPH
jgi:hypothetical protein